MRPKFLLGSAFVLLALITLQMSLASDIPEVTATEAQSLIAVKDKPLVLAVTLPGNVMSRGLSKIMTRLQSETGDSVRYAQVDMTKVPELAKRYDLKGPAVLVFNHGKLRANQPLIESKEELLALLQ